MIADLELTGRRGLVTGASRGIGFGIAERLVRAGASVGICSRDGEAVGRALERLRAVAPEGTRVEGGAVDVANAGQVTGWTEAMAAALGGLDLLVVNASSMSMGRDESAWRLAFEVDLLGARHSVEAAECYLERSDGPSIVFVSSISTVALTGSVRAYASVKAALTHYAASLALDLGAKGIRVNVVSPGLIFFEGGLWDRKAHEAPEEFRHVQESCPLGRMGRPEEVAAAVAFLLSPAAGYISGANLAVDGAFGRSVRY